MGEQNSCLTMIRHGIDSALRAMIGKLLPYPLRVIVTNYLWGIHSTTVATIRHQGKDLSRNQKENEESCIF